MHRQQVDLALDRVGADWHVNVRLAQVSVPFWNLIFENAMIPKCIPRQTANFTMVLMCSSPMVRSIGIRILSSSNQI